MRFSELPEDLARLVLEQAARDHRRTAARLIRLNKRVQKWSALMDFFNGELDVHPCPTAC